MANVKSRGLSALKIKHAPPGVHTDGAGLALRKAESGATNWILRLTISGRRRVYGLGAYPDVGLAEARSLALEYRKRARKGLDPRPTLAPPAPTIPTLEELTDKVIELRSATWTGPRMEQGWRASLERHILPALGNAPINEITAAHVLDCLTAIWTSTPSMAGRVRQRLASVFDYAIAAGYRTDNPAQHVKAALPQRRRGQHRAALPYAEMPAAFATIRESDRGSETARLALQFVILTACRSAEVCGAEWDEIDADAAIWTIPPERMKMRVSHRVPLSEAAFDVLDRARAIGGGHKAVFALRGPVRGGRAISTTAILQVLKKCGIVSTVHGFRSAFRTWALESTNSPFAVCEAALAHNLGGGEVQPYIRSDQLERRRQLMDDWGNFVAGAFSVQKGVDTA